MFLIRENVKDAEGKDQLQVTAVLGLHVDDIIMSALSDFQHHLQDVEQSFEWGGPWQYKDFTFVGRRIVQNEDHSIHVDQAAYVAEVPLTKTKKDPETKVQDYSELVTEFRSGIGSLQWLSGTTRGDISADTSLLQKPPKDLTVKDLDEGNSVLRYVRATNSAYFKVVPVNLDSLVFVCYGDSGWANAPNSKSQGGLVVVATDKSVLEGARPASFAGMEVLSAPTCSTLDPGSRGGLTGPGRGLRQLRCGPALGDDQCPSRRCVSARSSR